MALTAQFYAGDTDKLWTTYSSGGTHTGTPGNNGLIQVWQDEATPGTRNLALHTVNYGSSLLSAYQTPGVMRLSSIQFNGTNDAFFLNTNIRGSSLSLSSLFANNGKTIIMAIRFPSAGTNSTNPWDNAGIFSDQAQGYMGLHLKTVSSVHSVIAYNWDGNSDSCSVNVSLNTDYVLMMRHNGTTLNLSVLSGNSGTTRVDASVASGNTQVMTNYPRIGINRSSVYCPMILGEAYFDNTDLGSTNSVLTDFVSRWLPAPTVNRRRRFFIGTNTLCG